MNQYRVHYKTRFGTYKYVIVKAKTKNQALVLFNKMKGDCIDRQSKAIWIEVED